MFRPEDMMYESDICSDDDESFPLTGKEFYASLTLEQRHQLMEDPDAYLKFKPKQIKRNPLPKDDSDSWTTTEDMSDTSISDDEPSLTRAQTPMDRNYQTKDVDHERIAELVLFRSELSNLTLKDLAFLKTDLVTKYYSDCLSDDEAQLLSCCYPKTFGKSIYDFIPKQANMSQELDNEIHASSSLLCNSHSQSSHNTKPLSKRQERKRQFNIRMRSNHYLRPRTGACAYNRAHRCVLRTVDTPSTIQIKMQPVAQNAVITTAAPSDETPKSKWTKDGKIVMKRFYSIHQFAVLKRCCASLSHSNLKTFAYYISKLLTLSFKYVREQIVSRSLEFLHWYYCRWLDYTNVQLA